MLAVAEGDLDAFDEIVLRHQKLAWGIAYRFLGDPHEAEDIAQEAFLRILDAVGRYRPTAAFTTYLSRIVTRLCLDHARKKRPISADSLPAVQGDNPSVAERLAVKDRDMAIRQAERGLIRCCAYSSRRRLLRVGATAPMTGQP